MLNKPTSRFSPAPTSARSRRVWFLRYSPRLSCHNSACFTVKSSFHPTDWKSFGPVTRRPSSPAGRRVRLPREYGPHLSRPFFQSSTSRTRWFTVPMGKDSISTPGGLSKGREHLRTKTSGTGRKRLRDGETLFPWALR